jgi:hypothetical protein
MPRHYHCNLSQAAGYNQCELPPYVMERKLLYFLERSDSVRSECFAELISFIRKAIPNAPSQCCTGQESVASDAAAACCIELLR